MQEKIAELKSLLHQSDVFEQATALLMWDQVTNMPPDGAPARAQQIGAVKHRAKEVFLSPELGQLLDDLQPFEESTDKDDDDAALIRLVRRNYEREEKLPPDFWGRYEKASAAAFDAWRKAREEGNWGVFAPHLEGKVELCQEMASYYDGYEHPADAILAFYEYGMTAQRMRGIFSEMKAGLSPIFEAAQAQEPRNNDCLFGHFDIDQQMKFAKEVITAFGYDWKRGRIDRTQPRMVKVSPNDVRLLVRLDDDFLDPGLFCTTHESGHGLYELGISSAYAGTPMGIGVSAGMHESSALFWEAQVARSLSFWKFFYPKLQEFFPSQFANFSLEDFYQSINWVHPTLIRTDGDEITYNFHLMIRYEIELALLDGKVKVDELPELWDSEYEEYMGIHSEDIRQGVLQDPHWSGMPIGGIFQSYALGRIYGAIWMEAAQEVHPNIDADMEQGNFENLHAWLIENVYQHGSKYTPDELIEQISGKPISVQPFLDYVNRKYGALYEL